MTLSTTAEIHAWISPNAPAGKIMRLGAAAPPVEREPDRLYTFALPAGRVSRGPIRVIGDEQTVEKFARVVMAVVLT